MAIKFIVDYPAVFLADRRILVISDLHIGLEYELFKSGITIPPQGEKFQKAIDKMIGLTKAKTLAVLGDIKHKVPGVSFREEREIPKLLTHLAERVKVVVCLGNHDTDLCRLAPKGVEIHSSQGFKAGRYGFFHGHAWPSKALMQCDYLFMGHTHPAVEFRDRLGYRLMEHVWVGGKLNERLVKKRYKIDRTGELNVIIVPTFNPLLGGVALNATPSKDLIGPMLANRFMDICKSKAYLLDGTALGIIKRLKK